MRPKAEWAIDSEAVRARGKKYREQKKNSQLKLDFFAAKKLALFATSGL